MAIARGDSGWWAGLAALLSQIHPVFMLPPVAVSLFGALLAGQFSLPIAALHASAITAAVYVAHVKDGYVDFHRRNEDDDHPLTIAGCRLGLVVGTAGFVLATLGLLVWATPLAVALTLPTWPLGYFHAPTLDTNPVGATVGYPVGVALAVLGGYAAQTGSLSPATFGFAGVLFVLLSGVKMVDDAQDVAWDGDYGKQTVAVRIGARRAKHLSYALLAIASGGVVALALFEVVPDGAVVGVFAFGAIAALAADADAERATMLLIRGAYVLLALFVVAVWYRPLEGGPIPGGSVLGPYLYLASEVLFGTVALVLLWWTGTLWSAAKTIAVLYPIAFVWDWYTLEVGVFAILRRTGIEIAGIPLEEHLFIVVVPAFVIALHEARQNLTGSPDS